MRKIRLTILGSTGSIGRSALEVVRQYPDRFEVVALAAHSNLDLMAQQIAEFSPSFVAVVDEAAADRLHSLPDGVQFFRGIDGLSEIAAIPSDVVLCAVVGAVGLTPVLKAIDAGIRVALANKEPMVMAGPLIMDRARERGVTVMPVDSEHSAIFQCLQGHRMEDVECVHLTASGGPFYRKTRDSLRDVLPQQAVRHPTWDMGAKISVDSATLMNKGLETIEAMWLFDLPLEKVKVVIHPQSIIHSLVEFTDGQMLAHLGPTDMKFPIVYAFTYPERVNRPMSRLDLTTMKELTFAAPDFSQFPCLAYAHEAAARGGTAPAVLNAANETAVGAFCDGRLPFLQISDVVRDALDHCTLYSEMTLESVLEADRQGREVAGRYIEAMGAVHR
ncbi:MAG: 1-deoxy-D-xylulose 5-phosphate reductoisomerase [Candidatus Hydrogenedentota bacterium]